MNNDEMNVIKRDGSNEPVSFDKVLKRIRAAAVGLSVNYTRLAQLVLAEIHDGVHTSELDELAARQAISYMTVHPDWGTLAARIIVSNCLQSAPPTFSAAMAILSSSKALATGVSDFIQANAAALDAMIKPENDYLLDYFGFKTLEKAYLMKVNKQVVETPQYMWLRVAVGIWSGSGSTDSLRRIKETYDLMSAKAFTHATPTLFNSGTPRPQLSSCFLIEMKADSIDGIFDTLKDCAQISKYAGGIGLHVHNIRAQGTPIAGTQGVSNGLVPMLRVFNNTARYVDQCFAPHTEVLMKEGVTCIANIRPGDFVMTSGCTESVEESGKHYVKSQAPASCKVLQKTVHRYTGTIYHLTFNDDVRITVTPKHPFLAYLPTGECDYVEVEKLECGSVLPYVGRTSVITRIETEEVADMDLYDLEIEGTHDYLIKGVGFAHNGGGKRNGSFAIYLEPWHADIQAFLKMKSNTGSEEERARDLFYALWIPDLFMKRVEAGGDWSLFCPHEAPGLADVVGADFEALYTQYEQEGRAKRSVSAQKLWSEILVSQIETGTPYLLYKDAANQKSNQKNLGVIKSSNLCVAPETEITIYDAEVYLRGATRKGATIKVPISSVVGQQVKIWNGQGFSLVHIHKTGENQALMRVTVEQRIQEQGRESRTERAILDCTHYHKFILNSASDERVEARDLVPGQELCTWIDENGTLISQTVISVEDTDRIDDSYCFNEPINHAGVFNGILTGNCTEIIEFSSPEETAVCNLASIALPYFVTTARTFDFERLREVVRVIVRNLNRVIDINYYPTPETKRSNMRHRPIGIGVQGLADVFAVLGLPWETEAAAALNQEIFENIYFSAAYESSLLAVHQGPYETFKGSPASQGLLQPDLWTSGATYDQQLAASTTATNGYKSAAYLDWDTLRTAVVTNGLRNSLLVAPMPTASTSQILGYNECIEPFTTNIYVRRTLAGEFTVINKYLVQDLMALGLWSPALKERIVAANGSIQAIAEIPATLKALYKTVWEIKQKTLIDMAADRGQFICQSQSLNLFVQDPTIAKLSSMHFYAWKKGLKTGLYYLRTKSAVQAIKFTVDASAPKAKEREKGEEPAECLLCSS